MTESRDALAEELRTALSAERPSESCPSPEEWLEWAEDRLDEERARVMEDHRDECGVCAAEARLAATFVASQDEVAGRELEVAKLVGELEKSSPATRAGTSRPGVGRWLALAATLLAAFLLAQLWLGREATLPPPATDGVVRGSEIVLTTALGSLAVPPERIAWQGVEDAASYRVELRRVDGRLVWQGESSTTSLELPGPLRLELEPAVRYAVVVSAVDAEGRELARSAEQDLTLLPEARP